MLIAKPSLLNRSLLPSGFESKVKMMHMNMFEFSYGLLALSSIDIWLNKEQLPVSSIEIWLNKQNNTKIKQNMSSFASPPFHRSQYLIADDGRSRNSEVGIERGIK